MAARRRSIEVSRAVTGSTGEVAGSLRSGGVWPAQHGIEVLGMPAQGQRERLKCAGAAAALGCVAMQLTHDRHRYLSAFGQLALPPVQLGKPRINRLRDRRPVLLHPFLRAPP